MNTRPRAYHDISRISYRGFSSTITSKTGCAIIAVEAVAVNGERKTLAIPSTRSGGNVPAAAMPSLDASTRQRSDGVRNGLNKSYGEDSQIGRNAQVGESPLGCSSGGVGCEDYAMANKENLAQLQQGMTTWNSWRSSNPDITPDLVEAIRQELIRTGSRNSDVFGGRA